MVRSAKRPEVPTLACVAAHAAGRAGPARGPVAVHGGRAQAKAARLRARHPSAARRALRALPRAEAAGEPAAPRLASSGLEGRDVRRRDRARKEPREPARPAPDRGAHAPHATREAAARRGRDRADRGLDRRGRRRARRRARCARAGRPALGLSAAAPAGAARAARHRLGQKPDRRVRPRAARARGPCALARGLERDARSPAEPRPRRPAADAPGDRHLRERREPGCLRRARRPAARLAALRRALGASLARPRALRRHQRLREGPAPHGLEVPRLGDRRA